MRHATNLYTVQGLEVRSFSQLKNIFFAEDTFVLASGPARVRYVAQDYPRWVLLPSLPTQLLLSETQP
jgi:hypothetical protein